jgi:hypothetical protein
MTESTFNTYQWPIGDMQSVACQQEGSNHVQSPDHPGWSVAAGLGAVGAEAVYRQHPATQGTSDLLCLVRLQAQRGSHQPSSPVFGQACGPVRINAQRRET